MIEFNPDTQLLGISTDHVVFILEGDIASVEAVAKAVKTELQTNSSIGFHLIVVPRGALVCDQVFTEFGILGNFEESNSLLELPVIYPLDYDLLSLEMRSSYYKYHVQGDSGMVFDTASAIMHIQSRYGVIPVVRGVGKAARKVFQVMTRLKDEADEDAHEDLLFEQNSKIDYLFIIDRSVDLVTPLMGQMAYEGLIDEFFDMKNGSAKFPSDKFTAEESSEKNAKKKDQESIHFNSSEEFYTKIRDKNFVAVGPLITATLKKLSSLKVDLGNVTTPKEIKEIVDKIPFFRTAKASVMKHLAIAELIRDKKENEDFYRRTAFQQDLVNLRDFDVDYLEESIFTNQDPRQVLSLLCLLSLTKGLKKSVLDNYRREVFHSFGIEMLPTLLELGTAGLLKASSGTSYIPGSQTPYSVLKKNLNLVDPKFKEKFDPQTPNCYHPYDGYLPLSVKLVELLFKSGLSAFNETTRACLGTVFEEVQLQSRDRFNSTASIKSSSSPDDGKTVLVVFLGGCTYSEVSCLRILSQQEDMNADFVTLTTDFVKSNTLLNQFIHQK